MAYQDQAVQVDINQLRDGIIQRSVWNDVIQSQALEMLRFRHLVWLAIAPKTADGKPNLSAPAPRTADGKPDLSGLWEMERKGRLLPDTPGGNRSTWSLAT